MQALECRNSVLSNYEGNQLSLSDERLEYGLREKWPSEVNGWRSHVLSAKRVVCNAETWHKLRRLRTYRHEFWIICQLTSKLYEYIYSPPLLVSFPTIIVIVRTHKNRKILMRRQWKPYTAWNELFLLLSLPDFVSRAHYVTPIFCAAVNVFLNIYARVFHFTSSPSLILRNFSVFAFHFV